MTRFLIACVLVAAGSITAVVLLGNVIWNPPAAADDNATVKGRKVEQPLPPPRNEEREPSKAPAATVDADKNAVYVDVAAASGDPQPLVIQDGRVLPTERQDVPSERDGKILFVATEARPGEVIPRHKEVFYEVGLLIVEITRAEWEATPAKDRIQDGAVGRPGSPARYFRRARVTDEMAPGATAIVRQKLRFRKLDIGDRVQAGQLLGVINPAQALDDMAAKQAKVDSAAADVRAAIAFEVEMDRKLASMQGVRAKVREGVSTDELGQTRAQRDRYREEKASKQAAVRQAQRELSGALTTLNLHMVRASIDGVIKAVYKQHGESVKNLEPVLQIQNPARLRVEAQLDVQDALPLRDRLERARKLRDQADALRAEAMAQKRPEPAVVRKLEQEADELVKVQVEASRVSPPLAALPGHLQEVTCVAVTSETLPRIVSGSEDHTVRLWERIPGADRWRERVRLDHHAVVRSLACTGPKAKVNLLLTGTATGRARLFDLGNLKAGERFLDGRHSGAISAVAFSADGKRCVTGGEDRSICLWETEEGKLLGKVSSAHGQGVTSLTFTARNQVVSAGRDKRLVVWKLVEGGEAGRTLEKVDVFDRRSGDVAMLGVDPTGEHTLFDDGREIRALSLSTKKIEGTLQNASATATFTTMALYSPDGNTILTNGNAGGRLQLWRAPSATARPAELRQYVWSSGSITCGAFSPDGRLVVTGTQDHRVLVWPMPAKAEAQTASLGQLNYVEEFLDTSLRRVTVRATLDNPGWIIPGQAATIVVPPLGNK
jgi:hypothetical protein